MGSEVKGIWFLVARDEIDSRWGAEAYARLAASVPARYRSALTEPLASTWYPEEALQCALEAMREDLVSAEGPYRELLFACTQRGMGRFFRAMMRITTPHFVLRQVPTMWRHIRRDRAQIEVALGEDTSRVTYSRFPYFDDPNYRVLVEASLSALVQPTVGHEVPVRVEDFGDDWLRVAITHG
ncbi:MAG: hypothetical protein KC766_09290 [Myxococcales bacterium]|nr:hypothetical protein [Myxococcales bacterium]